MLISTFCFGLANLCVKFVAHLPAMEMVFFRCSMGVLFCWYALRGAGADWRGSSRWSLLLRGMFGTGALFLFFTTLKEMPMASAITIAYLSPIFTAVLAMFILKERVAGFQWVFFGMAFLGVALIEKFDPRVSPFYLTVGVVSAFGSGVAYNLVRSMRGAEHPMVVVLHFQLFGAVAGLISLFFDWKMPQGRDWLFLLLIAVFSQLGQMFLTKALQSEKASSVSIAGYSGVLYGLFFGWMFFDEMPAPYATVGIFLVVAGMIASVYVNALRHREQEIHLTQA